MAKLLIPAIFIVLFTLAAGRSYCRRRTYISRWGKPHVTTAPRSLAGKLIGQRFAPRESSYRHAWVSQ